MDGMFDKKEFYQDIYEDEVIDLEGSPEQIIGDETFGEFQAEDDYEFSTVIKAEDYDVAQEVENALLYLIGKGDSDLVLQISGEIPNKRVEISQDLDNSISKKYARAVQYNPALKWYSKILRLTEGRGLSVKDGNLSLRMSRKDFKTTIQPHMSDFAKQYEDESEIVSLVRNMYASIVGEDWNEGKRNRKHQELTNRTKAEDDLDINPDIDQDEDDYDYSEMLYQKGLDVEEGPLETFDMDDNRVGEKKECKLDISLQDFGIKAIAEFFHENEMNNYEEIRDIMQNEGFNREKQNQVMSILRYLNVNKGIESIKPKANKSPESTNFKF